jgi:hypothetical protein
MGIFNPSPTPEPKEPRIRTVFNIAAAVAGVFGLGLEVEGTHPYIGILMMVGALAYGGWELFTSPAAKRVSPLVRVSFLVVLSGLLIWVSSPHLVAIASHIMGGEAAPSAQARIRILNVVAIPTSASGAPFPAITIYYDNAGPGVAKGIVNHFAAGFGGTMSEEAAIAEQDKLLQWDGWKSEMDRRGQYEMHPGDPGEFTTIPGSEGVLAQLFRDNFDKVVAATTVLHIFITFKYFDPSGKIGVTEDCFWFSGNFARHDCGRGRNFLEEK